MNLAELERKLFEAARAQPPADTVPFAFEKRVVARIRSRPVADHWAIWASALWRAAAPCVALTLLLGAWSFWSPGVGSTAVDLSQEFENTVLAAADQESAADSAW